MENPEAVPIFPNAIHSPNLLSMMDFFWGTEAAARLSTLIRDPVFLKSAQNMLSLNRQLSWWYQSGRIAFKPLRKTDTNSLIIQFHWLKKSKLEPAQLFTDNMSFLGVMEAAGIADCDGEGIKGWGRHCFSSYSGLGMETGHIYRLCKHFEIEPPNFEILQLSWDLLRVAAICGATKPIYSLDEANGDNVDHYGGYEDSDDHYDNDCRDDEDYDDDRLDGDYDDDDDDGMESQPDMYCDKNYAQLRHWGEEVEGQDIEELDIEGQEIEGQEVDTQEAEGLEDMEEDELKW